MDPKSKAKRFVRPDQAIAHEIVQKMKADIEVPDDRIDVDVKTGVVTITGTVSRDAQRDAAERCAKSTKGVRDIANRIEVMPGVTVPA